jgi:hypothetical protein
MDMEVVLNIDPVYDENDEYQLKKHVPCVCVLKNGRQHNIVITHLKDHGNIAYGHIGSHGFVCLYEPSAGARCVLLVDTPDNINKEINRPGERQIHFTNQCFTVTTSRMAIDVADISLIELPDAPVVERDPRLPHGGVDEELVCQAFPELNRFRLPHGGFASNPALTAIAETKKAEGATIEPKIVGGMPSFRYVALNPKGEEVTGVIEAESQAAAIAKVREDGNFPTQVRPVESGIQKRVPMASKHIDRFKTEDEKA